MVRSSYWVKQSILIEWQQNDNKMTTLYIYNLFILNKSQYCVSVGIIWVLHLLIGLATAWTTWNSFSRGRVVSPGVKDVTCRCVWRTLSWRCHAGDFPVSTLGVSERYPISTPESIEEDRRSSPTIRDYLMISMFKMFKLTFVSHESLVGNSEFWLMINSLLCYFIIYICTHDMSC